MNKREDRPARGYVPPRSLGDAEVQRLVESGMPESEAHEVVTHDYAAWDGQTYGDDITPVWIDLVDIGKMPKWASGSDPSIEHAVEIALQKDPDPYDRYVSAAWPGPAAGPAEEWGGAQAAAERALVPDKWGDPSQMTLEQRRVAVFDPATGKAAWFELIFASTPGPSDDEAIQAGSHGAQWHPFEYEAESEEYWDDDEEEDNDKTRMVTQEDSWTVMRLKKWRPNCLIADPPRDDELDYDDVHDLLAEGVLFSRLSLLVTAYHRWRDCTDPQRSAEPDNGWSDLLEGHGE